MRRCTRTCLLSLLAVVVAGCHRGPTEQEKQVMAQLTQSMKTQCMGRYLVDLPSSFNWLNPDLTLYYGRDENFKTLEVRAFDFKATPESVTKAVEVRASEIAKVINDDTHQSNLLAQIKEEESGGVMLRFNHSSYVGKVDHELHLRIGSTYVLIKGSSYENVPGALASADNTAAVEARMLKLAANIHPVTDPEKAGTGFCLGSVVVDSDNDFENADMTFNMTKHPDVIFDVWMDNQANPPDTLLERLEGFDKMAGGTRLKFLRSREMTLAGMPAQEKLARIEEDREQYNFTAESRPSQPSFAEEGVQVSLSTGNRSLNSSLTQNEALALWDAIIQSFRPRPNAVRSSPGK